jgi:DNA-binding GntR family transcriptional regulator
VNASRANARRTSAEVEGVESSVWDVVRGLEFDILFGRLKPRERLVEDGLMARFGTKRHVIRRALDELEHMGVIVRAPNRGAAVRDFSAQDVEDIYELRELLQHRAAERIPLPGDAALVHALTEIQCRHDAAVTAGDLRTVDQVNDLFHRVFFDACGNRQLADAIAHYSHLSRAMRVYPIADPITLIKLRDDHWSIIRAIEAGDRVTLLDLVRGHIQPSKAAYLKVRQAIDHA